MLGYQLVSAMLPPEAATEEGPRVLVVDDDKDVRDSLEYALGSYGMRVTLCGNATEALLFAMGERFDFILTDFEMPGLDGLELVRRLRGLQPDLTVIIGMGGENLHRCFLEMGANDFVGKPFVPHHVAMMLDGGDLPE